MKIGTWNVAYGVGGRNPDRRAILVSKDADVWVLTETNAALDLGRMFSPVSSEPRKLPDKGARWVTIWSRFPLLRSLPVPDPRRMVAAVFDSPGGPLAVAGVVAVTSVAEAAKLKCCCGVRDCYRNGNGNASCAAGYTPCACTRFCN